MNNHKKKHPPLWPRDIFSGGLAGATAGALGFPFLIMKKRSQVKIRSFTPSNLFLGIGTYASSIIANTAIIVGTKNILGRYLTNKNSMEDDDSTSSNYASDSLTTTFIAGCVAAIPTTIVDNIIVTQQLKKINGALAVNQLISKSYYSFLVSYPALACREGFYSAAMFCGTNTLRNYIENKYNANSYYLPVIPVAFGCCAFTQPFDTIAGIQQYYSTERHQSLSIIDAARHIYSTKGLKGFYRGFPYRLGLMTVCFSVIPPAEKYLNAKWDNHHSTFFSNNDVSNSMEPIIPILEKHPPCKP